MQTTTVMLPQPNPHNQPNQSVAQNADDGQEIDSNIQLLRLVFEEIENTGIVDLLEQFYSGGRRGYSKRAMFRAYVASFVMGYKYTNSIIRDLKDNLTMRELCGFERLPVRTTFNRFFSNMAMYDDLIEKAMKTTVDELKGLLPDLGHVVAVDSTAVKTYANPNRKTCSDPEAKWGVKHTAQGKDGKSTDWFFGYKAHMASDATYGLPLASLTTPGNANDTTYLTKVIDKAMDTFDWFQPYAVLADRGYDSKKNNDAMVDRGIHPIIKMKKPGGKKADDNKLDLDYKLIDDIYDINGVPHCMGHKKMEFIQTDPDKGHYYVCPAGGCDLQKLNSGAMLYCNFDSWEDPTENIRLFGTIRKDSDEWKQLYRMRYSVERGFKSMKQARRLEQHTIRGLRRTHAHILMAMLTAQVTVLVNLKHRKKKEMMWMVPRVA